MTPTVAIEDLKVGMFVHLDLGWWAHPFALSSFMVMSSEQLATIRGLGLKRLRWSPDKSRTVDPAAPEQALEVWGRDGADPAEGAAAGPALGLAAAGHPADPAAEPSATTCPQAGADQPAAQQTDAQAQQARRRALLADQRQATQLCAQQLAEARSGWLQATRCLLASPGQAHDIAQGLTDAVLDKLLGDGEVCVRTLADAGGEPAASHALNVMVVSLLVGRLSGLDAAALRDLGLGAMLHDIGKLALPERLRHADLALGPEAQAQYRCHVMLGVGQGQRMGLSAGALRVLAQHHEQADGQGFPARLAHQDIALSARIVALVNRYDKLCNPRQPALALTPHEALSTLFAQCRGQFDGAVMNAFIRLMGVYPPGSVVQLTDQRFASVVSVNPARPLKPRVLVCDPGVPPDEALLLDLDGVPDLGVRRSLKPALLPNAVRDYLTPGQRLVYFFEPAPLPAAADAEAVPA